MNNNTFDIIKKVLMSLLLISLIIVFVILLIKTRDNNFIKDVKKFLKNDTKVLYISDKHGYSDYPIQLLNKYSIQNLYIDSSNLSKIEKIKLEKIVNSKYLSNILIIFKNGKIIDAIINYETEDELNKFLQNNDIIPKVLGKIDGIIDTVTNALNTEFTVLYIPYKYIENIDDQDRILKEIANKYNIKYKLVNAYLLSFAQQEKLNSILEISAVEDQIIILIKDSKIIGSIRGINSLENYVDELYKYNFIQDAQNYINEIDYDSFNRILNSSGKSIILIGKDECKYCNEVISILNSIITNYKINVNYINIGKIDSELSSKVEKKLVELGYSDGFTTPITIMIESGKIIDYIIGSSTKQYFIDIFAEDGIIK